MATKVLTTLQDDIDGSNATQTIQFALDGVEYEIDVSDRNANRPPQQSGRIHYPWAQDRRQAHAQEDGISWPRRH
jgi:hypothetical protein